MSIKNKINGFLKHFNLQVHGLGYLQALAKGDFKKNEYDYFKKIFGKRQIVIYDIGANRGTTVLSFLNHFPSSKIYAFEPLGSLYNELLELFNDNKNVKVENVGIADTNGELIFYINKSVDTSSFLLSQKTGLNSDAQVKNISKETIPVKTISQSCSEEKIAHINILKLDIQGYELKALKGAEDLLRSKKIDLIYTEAYFIQQYHDQPLFPDIAMYLSNFGYRLQDIYNPIYGNDKIAWCDAIFMREDL